MQGGGEGRWLCPAARRVPGLHREQVRGGKVGEHSSLESSRHFLSSHLCYLPFMQWRSGFKDLGAAGTVVRAGFVFSFKAKLKVRKGTSARGLPWPDRQARGGGGGAAKWEGASRGEEGCWRAEGRGAQGQVCRGEGSVAA